MDMMMKVNNALIADKYIRDQTAFINRGQTDYRIKFYEYPETGDVKSPYIIIDPLGPEIDDDFADNVALTNEYLYQIEVWTPDRMITKMLAQRVKKQLKTIGFSVSSVGPDEYDSGIYRDARRYTGKAYTEEFEDAQ
jgi:hypothetical protein